jgi:glucose/mannose transport system permease protein
LPRQVHRLFRFLPDFLPCILPRACRVILPAPGENSPVQRLLARFMPFGVMVPTIVITTLFVYGFIAFSVVLSFTGSRMFPRFSFVGFDQYARLFSNPRWEVAVDNMLVFAILYIGLSTLIGLVLAILLDQKIRNEGLLRTIYLYPMAISFIVTGVVWQWILNPGLGIQTFMRNLGFDSFTFDWLVRNDMAIYCVVIAGVWQVSGYVMALFLAGLRGINGDIVNAARIDGAGTWQIYRHVILPQLRPMFLTAFVVQAHLAIKSYDLVVALTKGGPGFATELPSTFMYSTTFTRNEMGLGAASAVIMLCTIAAVVVPYLYSEIRHERRSA